MSRTSSMPHPESPCIPQVLYTGGGTIEASEELTEFARRCNIPVVSTLMGLGNFPASDPLMYGMLGMHGTVAANYSVDQSDLLLVRLTFPSLHPSLNLPRFPSQQTPSCCPSCTIVLSPYPGVSPRPLASASMTV